MTTSLEYNLEFLGYAIVALWLLWMPVRAMAAEPETAVPSPGGELVDRKIYRGAFRSGIQPRHLP